jgi:hypothetical protein
MKTSKKSTVHFRGAPAQPFYENSCDNFSSTAISSSYGIYPTPSIMSIGFVKKRKPQLKMSSFAKDTYAKTLIKEVMCESDMIEKPNFLVLWLSLILIALVFIALIV